MTGKHGQGKPSTPANHLSGEKPVASHANTKAPMTKTVPGGNPHAHVSTMQGKPGRGKYL